MAQVYLYRNCEEDELKKTFVELPSRKSGFWQRATDKMRLVKYLQDNKDFKLVRIEKAKYHTYWYNQGFIGRLFVVNVTAFDKQKLDVIQPKSVEAYDMFYGKIEFGKLLIDREDCVEIGIGSQEFAENVDLDSIVNWKLSW